MNFTKEQLSEAFVKHLDREKGLQDLMELMIESMMMAERRLTSSMRTPKILIK
jgi:putative transposase